MVEQFEDLAKKLDKKGHGSAAFKTRKFYKDLFARKEITFSLSSEEQREATGSNNEDLSGRPERIFSYPGFTFYPERGFFIVGGQETLVTKIESDILELLVTNPNRFLSAEVILGNVWGPEYALDTGGYGGLVRWHVKNLRHKLEPKKRKDTEFFHLLGLRGFGYKFVVPDKKEQG